MFTYNERDLHRMPTPARTHLPVKQYISDTHILEDYTPGDNEVRFSGPRIPHYGPDPSLLTSG